MSILPLLFTLAVQSTTVGLSPDLLWNTWPEERFVTSPAPCIRPAELERELQRLAKRHPEDIEVTEAGRSFRGRPIHLVTLGHGPRIILLWSQMHGDEASATPALLDIAHFLLSRSDQPDVARILDELTLQMIPMLNPDGAEVYERRNAQGIDINRDALTLATPEGRILKRIRDGLSPELGFNLHDQTRRTSVGDSGVLATNALLAVAGDKDGTLTPGRQRAKRVCASIAATLQHFVPGGVARFDEDWNPRAFGDNMTAWGTPVVLLESGGLPPGRDLQDLTRLNFVALLHALDELARDDAQSADPEIYEQLQRNRRDAWADVVVRGGFITQPWLGPPYPADLAFNIEVDDRTMVGCPAGSHERSRIVEVGDTRFLGTGRVVDASDTLLVTPFVAGVKGWSARRWLSAEALSEVARLGVGTVMWEVPRRKLHAAHDLADELRGAGRARLEVVPAPAELPWLTLSGPPLHPASDSIADVVTALLGDPRASAPTLPPSLEELVGSAHRSPKEPTPGRGQPASFVLLAPAPEGRIDLATAGLSAVFVNGLELTGVSR